MMVSLLRMSGFVVGLMFILYLCLFSSLSEISSDDFEVNVSTELFRESLFDLDFLSEDSFQDSAPL